MGCSFARHILMLSASQAEHPFRLHTISVVINLVYRWRVALPERPSSQYRFLHCIHSTEGEQEDKGTSMILKFC